MQAFTLTIFRTLLKGTKKATSFFLLNLLPHLQPKSCAALAVSVGRNSFLQAPKALCQHFHYGLSSRTNQKQSFTHIFNLSNAPFPPHLRLTKKAVQCLSQIILGLDTHACICETPLASHHKAPFHAETLDQETWSSHTPQRGAQIQILVLQLQLRLL